MKVPLLHSVGYWGLKREAVYSLGTPATQCLGIEVQKERLFNH